MITIMSKIDQIGKVLDTATSAIDDNFESEQERQTTLTERLKIDTTSPFKLPHLIRPIAFIWAMSCFTILSLITLLKVGIDDIVAASVMASITTILTAIVGFYFQSRKHEKISLERNKTALKLEELKTKSEIRQDEKDGNLSRREQKKENRRRRRV